MRLLRHTQHMGRWEWIREGLEHEVVGLGLHSRFSVGVCFFSFSGFGIGHSVACVHMRLVFERFSLFLLCVWAQWVGGWVLSQGRNTMNKPARHCIARGLPSGDAQTADSCGRRADGS
jgi:hypothetical protein